MFQCLCLWYGNGDATNNFPNNFHFDYDDICSDVNQENENNWIEIIAIKRTVLYEQKERKMFVI